MSFFDWLRGGKSEQADAQRLTAAVDCVIEAADPRLKAIGNVRERLSPAVEHALAWIHQGVERLPGAVELTPENWVKSPLLRAVFARPAEVAEAIATSQDVRSHLAAGAPAAGDTLYGIVAATRVERTVLGSAMQDGMLRRDVAQRTVSFQDIRIAGFLPDEAGLRLALEDFVLEQLVLSAMRDVARSRERGDQIDAYRQLLQMRIRLLEQGGGGLSPALEGGASAGADLDRLRTELAANEAELKGLRAGSGFEGQLEAIVAAFERAREIVNPLRVALRVDAMNIIVGDEVADAAQIELIEFSTLDPTRPRRIGFFAHFPRSALVARQVDYDAMLRSL